MKRLDRALPSARVVHRHAWIWEPLESEPGFVLRAMFGAKAVYLDGKIVLCCSTGEEPWCGVLVPTDRAHHDALRAEFPALVVHSVLGKWLYLPESADAFERTATALVGLIRRRDPRIGVVPKSKKRRATASVRGTRSVRTRSRRHSS
ncbi:MAG: hypothetical protein HYV96_12905 [Opitutae bacterium]|nr:hypothetical protein [Opitutae bacterium]